MALLVAAVLLVLGLALGSDSLCSPTAFYKDCWIRRFPGLLVDLQESQRRGAQVLKVYAEVSPQQCSRTCCLLRNASCNLAVFYHGAIHGHMNCLHVSCPALESCILKAGMNVILYNITTGIDPDLLVFGKPTSKEPNIHSPQGEHERQNSAETTEGERCRHRNATSGSPLLQAPAPTTSRGSAASTYTSSTSPTLRKNQVTAHPRAETFPAGDQRTSTTSASPRQTPGSDKKAEGSAPTARAADGASHMPTPPRLNSSKQHLNETKGYSGRNSTLENEAPAWEASALGVWLIPAVLCSSLLCLCCCTAALTTGRCSNRRGHYRPLRRRTKTSRQSVKYAAVRSGL
ncbi:MANSC domain-containing protein 4 [Myiozetetes cayanensis]|uniref:MANSC domain-containing protein 4 n=1 Tax=Myiozetetes cayanensis TaxID=478635 RepID=UPI00215FF2A1|nr:MANSC domain-containing protein 4 [Myiozetetes cayanensis]